MDAGTEADSNNWAQGYGTDVYGDENCDVLPYTGMVWGLGYTNGTYFSGNPFTSGDTCHYIYGLQKKYSGQNLE